ncbi:hypothetical protein [Anaerosporobacter sp.]|uniref:hypothetical protein n=1 Tax=Anaerosporobacter sp. TaxID=1872529 RepID=UPI00286F3C7F|nr:hypothetical protein [Anaerosporobacter sp.]
MKEWTKLIKYRNRMYLMSNKIVVPLIVYLLFTYISYKEKPQFYIPDVMVSSISVGYIMFWISFTFFENEDIVAERVLYCNIQQNKLRYYGSKIATLLLISAVLSFIGAAYPFLVNAVNGFELFKTSITFTDFCCSFVIHMLMSCIFVAVSYLFQPRNIFNRRHVILLMVIIVVISLGGKGIISKYEMAKYVLLVFPPVGAIIDCFYGLEYFTVKSMLSASLYAVIYSVIVFAIGIFVVDKKDF